MFAEHSNFGRLRIGGYLAAEIQISDARCQMLYRRFAAKRQLMRGAHLRLGIVRMQLVQAAGKGVGALAGPVAIEQQ